MSERLDLIIFGASGFTGKYAVEELNRITKYFEKDISWGIAGRSREKLNKVLNDVSNKTGDNFSNVRVIIADISNEEDLLRMTSQARVVINCCGPYRFHGEPVVKACVETGTHHVDVSGEPAFMEKMQLRYNEAAEKAGVYIVSACGFDSIPADMGVVFLQQNFDGVVNSVETSMRMYTSTDAPPDDKAVFHYATWESLVNGVSESAELKSIRKQLYPQQLPFLKPHLSQRSLIHKNNSDNYWYVPFLGADRPVVNRTQRFLHDNYNTRPVQMHAYFGFPRLMNALSCICMGAIVSFLIKYNCGKKLLLNHPKVFTLGVASHQGPTEEKMKNTRFYVTISGEGWNANESLNNAPSKKMKIEVTGVNPCYGATCTSLIYSAIALIKENHKIPGNGGVLTPGAAFMNTNLIENLRNHNFKFDVVSVEDQKSKL